MEIAIVTDITWDSSKSRLFLSHSPFERQNDRCREYSQRTGTAGQTRRVRAVSQLLRVDLVELRLSVGLLSLLLLLLGERDSVKFGNNIF